MFRLLFVDDESIYRLTIHRLVDWASYGFSIAGTASNGEEALSFLAQTPVDGIITDLEMPVMDGITFIKKLRSAGFSGPILALSNYSDYDHVRGALTAGAFDYIVKIEINPERMDAALKKMSQFCLAAASPTQDKKPTENRAHLLSLLLEYIESPVDEQPSAQLYRIIPNAFYPLCLCTVKVFRETANTGSLSAFLETSIRERFKALSHVFLFPIQSGEFLLLISQDDMHQAQVSISDCLQILRQEISTFLSVKPLLTFVQNITDLPSVKERYWACVASYQRSFYTDFASIVDLTGQTECDLLPMRDAFVSGAISSLKSARSAEFSMILEKYVDRCSAHLVPPTFLKDSLAVLAWCCRDLHIMDATAEAFETFSRQIEAATDSTKLTEIALAFFSDHVPSTGTSRPTMRQEISDVMFYVNQNYSSKLTLEQLASHVGMTREHLSRLFLKETGTNLFQYIIDVRMRKAAELLSENNSLLIKEVALAVGFDNQYAFSSKFKEYYGISPMNYKEQTAENK